MIFGKLELKATTLETHNDSYVLAGISAISARRPFLSAGLTVGALSVLFVLSFSDILFPREMILLTAMAILVLWIGLSIGQLRLISRDLRGSPISDAIYGTYTHLNRLRPEIAEAVEHAKSGGAA